MIELTEWECRYLNLVLRSILEAANDGSPGAIDDFSEDIREGIAILDAATELSQLRGENNA